MKKLISVVVVLMLCLSLACPVFAAEDTFVPSISVKDGPAVVPGVDEEGNAYIARIVDADGKVLGYVTEDCLVITPVSKAATSEMIPSAAEEQLLAVFNQLVDGSMVLPYDKFNANLDPDKTVVREMVDVSWLCEDHPETIAPAGVHVEVVFDLGVGADTEVYVMSYKNNEWNPIVETTNNGDGTITCVFEDFCPVAFSVSAGSSTNTPSTGDAADLTLWIVLLAVSALALTAVVVFRRKIAR